MEIVKIFKHNKFGNLRVMVDNDGKPWFVGKVVAELLGYSNTSDALKKHVPSHHTKLLSFKVYRESRETKKLWSFMDYRDKTLIDMSGVYRLIFNSHLERAEQFTDWVTEEVLPQIHRTGNYIGNPNALGIGYEGVIHYDEDGVCFYPLKGQPVKEKSYVANGKAHVKENGTFEFVRIIEKHYKSKRICTMDHGCMTETEKGAVRICISVHPNEGLDIASVIRRETNKALKALAEYNQTQLAA